MRVQKDNVHQNREQENLGVVDLKWTSAKLLERGWTKTSIKKFLVPCEFCANPYYRYASPMALYDPKEVEEAEKRPEVIAYFLKSEKRKLSAKKAVETKTQKTFEFIQKKIYELKPPKRLPIEEISKRAKKNRQVYLESIGEWSKAMDVGEPDKRQMCNYIRHTMINNYNDDCWCCYGKTGVDCAYTRYKQAVMELIFSVYPELMYDWN